MVATELNYTRHQLPAVIRVMENKQEPRGTNGEMAGKLQTYNFRVTYRAVKVTEMLMCCHNNPALTKICMHCQEEKEF